MKKLLTHVRRLALALAPAALLLGPALRPSWAQEAPQKPEPEPERKPLLWVVEDEPKVYLFGTIHVPDTRVTTLPAAVEKAIAESDVILTEIPMDPATMMKAQGKMMLPGGQTIDQVLPAELYERVKKLLAATIPEPMWKRQNVFGVFSLLQARDLFKDLMAGKQPLDTVLHGKFVAAKKETDALETVDEQLSIFLDLTQEEQVTLLEDTVESMEKAEKEGRNPVNELIELYLEGDAEKLYDDAIKAAADEAKKKDPESDLTARLLKKLIDDRNVRMVNRLLSRRELAPQKTFFVAVGAGHYGGPVGILKLLREKGIEPKRVEPTPAPAPAEAR